jgi:hypothetical protein
MDELSVGVAVKKLVISVAATISSSRKHLVDDIGLAHGELSVVTGRGWMSR